MKAISIRGIEPEVSDKLKKIAQKDGKSVNQFIVDMIKQNMGMQKEKKYSKTYNDIDHLFGRWSASEFKKISKSIESQRKIDMELWK
ncbi:MAG: antitoxin [Desulfobacteraceae bacterium]|nr:antitoxin [Desulfobacteraceae bacterium]